MGWSRKNLHRDRRAFLRDPIYGVALALPLVWLAFEFCRGDLNTWDTTGHLLAARNFRDAIFPWFSGWNSQHLLGYPQGYFYPSLLHWTVGGIARGLPQTFPLEIVFRGVVLFALALLPIALFDFLRAAGLNRFARHVAVLLALSLWFTPKGSTGGDAFGTFAIGLVSQQFAIPFALFYLASLLRLLRRPVDRRNRVSAAVFLALTVLSHAFVTLQVAGLSLALLAVAIVRSGKRGSGDRGRSRSPLLFGYAFHGILALVLSAVWWVPYLSLRGYQTGKSISLLTFVPELTRAPAAIPLLLFFLVSLIIALAKLPEVLHPRQRATLILWLLGGGAVAFLGIFSSPSLPLHLYRWMGLIYMGIAAVLALPLAKLDMHFLARRPGLRNGMIGASLALYVIHAIHQVQHLRPVRSVSIEAVLPDRPAHRSLVNFGDRNPVRDSSPHLLADTLAVAGVALANGLFVESSLNSPAVQTVLTEIYNQPFRWGVLLYPVSPANAGWHLRVLGIDRLISDEPLLPEARENLRPLRSQDIRAHLERDGLRTDLILERVELGNSEAERIFSAPTYVGRHWEASVERWWSEAPRSAGSIPLLIDVRGRILPDSLPEPLFQRLPDDDSSLAVERTHPEGLSIQASSPLIHWNLLKQSYFPHWQAENVNGIPIPLYRAAPNLTAWIGNETTHFRFVRPWTEKAAAILSALAWIFLFIGWLHHRRSRRRIRCE